MNSAISRFLVAIGSVTAIGALFLPWIEIDNLGLVSDAISLVTNTLMTGGPRLIALITELNDTLERSLSNLATISGYDIIFQLSSVTTTTKLLALLPSIIAILGIVWIILSTVATELFRTLSLVFLALAAIGLGVFAMSMGRISRLGIESNMITDTVIQLLGVKTSWGMWVAAISVVCIIIGFALGLKTTSAFEEDEWPYYGESH